MKRNVSLAVLLVIFASVAYAGNPNPVAVSTFTCAGGTGLCPNGGAPNSLIQGSDGNFYGTATVSAEGGTALGGTVFSLTPAGTLKVLHTFVAGPNKDYANGNVPVSLTEGPDKKLYGYTTFGGIGGCNGECGFGVLYRVNTDGSGFEVIQKFCSTGCGFFRPALTSMVAAKDGNLYGTINAALPSIFRVTPSTGAYDIVSNLQSGGFPSPLTLAPDGTLYGMTLGTAPAVLFNYSPATGNLKAAAVNFPLIHGLAHSGPASRLTFGPNGNPYGLYGIYATNGAGLFEVASDGSHLKLFPFDTTLTRAGTQDGLMLASDGNFWMAESTGGSNYYGDIISLSPGSGTLRKTFMPFGRTATVGAYPAMLVQAKDGSLWGSASEFGTAPKGRFAAGTIFKLKAGLPPTSNAGTGACEEIRLQSVH